jgi:Ca2+-binding EF-hand superfamily protein
MLPDPIEEKPMKNSRQTGFVIAAALVAFGLTSSAPAYAEGERKGKPRIIFEELDTNADGKITTEEMSERRAARFAQRDTDGDGMLSKDELTAAALKQMTERVAKRTERMIEKRDTDGDGQISLAELSDGNKGSKLIERLDKDGDGAVSSEEFAAMKERAKKWRKKHGPRAGDETPSE